MAYSPQNVELQFVRNQQTSKMIAKSIPQVCLYESTPVWHVGTRLNRLTVVMLPSHVWASASSRVQGSLPHPNLFIWLSIHPTSSRIGLICESVNFTADLLLVRPRMFVLFLRLLLHTLFHRIIKYNL